MKKIIYTTALFCFLFALSAFSQPRLEIEGGDTYNWGKVKPEQSPLKASVKIFNKGTDTLKISEVKPGCGCTTAPLDKNNIEPNGYATLSITLNVSSDGKVTKSITIRSNDPKNGTKYMYLEAEVMRALQRFPNLLSFPSAEINKEVTSNLVLKNTTDGPITIKDVKVDPPEMIINLKHDDMIAANSEFQLKASFTPTKYGNFAGRITFKTTHPEVPTVEIQAWGNVIQPPPEPTKPIEASPAPAPVEVKPAEVDKNSSKNKKNKKK